jgi:soluble lytic murein transglycosylase
MSSMWRIASIIPVLLATTPSSSAPYAAPQNYAAAPAYAPSVASSLQTWRTLRQNSNYRFADYAAFLIANPDWPDESRMRGWAEKAMQRGENAATVIAFFAAGEPRTGNGFARLAEAYASTGQMPQALDAARQAWRSADLSSADEQAVWARFGNSFTRADNDDRVDALLFAKKPEDAARFLTAGSPGRQAAFAARIAMQQNAADAESRYSSVIGSVTSDAGLMMDRARWLRANNFGVAAQQLAARDHQFTIRPADPERFYDMLILLASDAVQDRNWQTAYNIASQIDDALPAGTDMPK